MPFGTFLDMFPSLLFVGAHIAFIVIGAWAIRRSTPGASWLAGPLWLYVISQPVFLAFFGGLITLKMAVLTEQTLLVVMVGWLAMRSMSSTRA